MPEHEREDIHRRILESLQTGVCLVNQKHKVRFWNEGAERLPGTYGRTSWAMRCDMLPREPKNPFDPSNRRISVIVKPGPTTGRERREIWRGRRRHVTSGRQRTFEFARKSRAE